MKKIWGRRFITVVFCLVSLNAFCGFHPVNLRCEYKHNPLGIDTREQRFSWIIDSPASGTKQVAYQLCVSTSAETLQAHETGIWDTGKVSSENNFSIEFSKIKTEPAKKYFWKVRVWNESGQVSSWSEIAQFSTGLLDQADWKGVDWIGIESLPDSINFIPYAHGKGENLGEKLLERAVNPYFRKAFKIERRVSEAYAFVSGLGQYEFSLNGEKVNDNFLVPGWTDYAKRCLYNSYDVTKLLKDGENVIGCLVGSGFFYINRERYRKLTGAFGFPMLRLILYIRYANGTVEKIETDESWKTFHSPVEYSGIYGGEDYNANKECPGWNQKGFNDSDWQKAKVVEGPGGDMKAQVEYPVKIMDVFDPVEITSPSSGKYVYDFGQNASGIIELKVKGQKGDTVKITPAELLDENGLVSQKSSGGPFYFQYILKGNGIETWRPRFTYYGFRYAMIEGAVQASEGQGQNAQIINLKHLHVRNSMPSSGSFKCSNDLFNRIFNLIDWAVKSNLVSVSTDCPHREKLGWLEQAHLMGESVKYNYDSFHLYNKVLDDMMEAQTEDGMVPSIAPEYVWFDGPFRDDPGYGSAMIIIPWYLYKWYGDENALERAYENMIRYMTYLSSKTDSNILSYGLGDWLDVGPESPGVSQLTPIPLTATAFYYNNTVIMSKIARILRREADAEKYHELALSIKSSFNRRFFNHEKQSYGSGSQTSLAMPLFMGIVDEDDYDEVLRNLKQAILADEKKITAGDIGHRFLVQSLRQTGEAQLLFDMNNRTDFGYGYQIKNGATALNENWSGEEYLSQNHMIMGHLMEWFYNGLAGIRQQENDAGYKNVIIEPMPVDGIDWVDASYQTMNGKVEVHWEKVNRTFLLDVNIPFNSNTKIVLPAKEPANVLLNGNKMEKEKEGWDVEEREKKVIVTLPAGNYHFECREFVN